MYYADIKGEAYFKNIVFDKKFYEAVQAYRLAWAQKNPDYIDFLGGNLTGTVPIRFSTVDEDKFFIDLLRVDRSKLEYDYHHLHGINKSFQVSSNVVYLTLVYLMYRTIESKTIDKYKNDLLKELYYIFAYKAISSLITHYFKYNVDESIAKVVYEKLSNRFLLKKLGSWQEVFNYRTKSILPQGLHYDRLVHLDTENATIIIADMQGRIRELMKNIFSVMMTVINNNEKIYSTSLIEVDDEGESTRSVANSYDKYSRYLKSIINLPNDFINDDLVYLTSHIVNNLDNDRFVETLKYISENYDFITKHKNAIDFIDISIETTISYIRTKGIITDYHKHALDILKHMKGYWSSSSVKDKEIKQVKEFLNDITYIAIGKKTKWVLASITIAVLLYIFLRSIYIKK